MKFISWNVNGLRACLKKGFEDVFNALDAEDVYKRQVQRHGGYDPGCGQPDGGGHDLSLIHI